MAQRDLHNQMKSVNAFHTQTISTNTTTNGVIIDTLGFEGVEFIIQAGVLTDGSSYTPTFNESDAATDPTFTNDQTAIVAPMLIGTTAVTDTPGTVPNPSYTSPADSPIADVTFVGISGADSHKIARIGVLNKKRYVRISIASLGVSSGGIFNAVAILGFPLYAPTSKDK
jgi:hypothetical protein